MLILIRVTIDASTIGSIKSGQPQDNGSRFTQKIEPRILKGPTLYFLFNIIYYNQINYNLDRFGTKIFIVSFNFYGRLGNLRMQYNFFLQK